MKNIFCLMAALSLTACDADNNSKPANDKKNGIFKATVGEKSYELDVFCKFRDDGGIHFYSEYASEDKDGDGFFVDGDEMNNKLMLNLQDNGLELTALNVGELTRNSEGAKSSGTLYDEQGGLKAYPVTLEVICK